MNYSHIYEITASSPQSQTDSSTVLRESQGDPARDRLFDALRATFHVSARRQFGVFDSDKIDVGLASGVRLYSDKQCTAAELGQRLAQQFQQALPNAQPHPWYLWFILESIGGDEFIYLFLLKQEERYHIEQQQVIASSAIDTSQLQYAVKLNLAEWLTGETKDYLCNLSPKNQLPVTAAWRALIGFAEGADRAVETEKFLQVVDSYVEALPPEKESDYRERVVNYCRDQERTGQAVELQALSRHVDEEEPDALLKFFTEHSEDPAPALYADRNQLKRYTRLYGRDQNFSISFSTAMLGQHITYDANADTLIIRSIPKSLRAQLARHSKK